MNMKERKKKTTGTRSSTTKTDTDTVTDTDKDGYTDINNNVNTTTDPMKTVEDIEKVKKSQSSYIYNVPDTNNHSILSLAGIRERITNYSKSKSSYLIIMQLRNGRYDYFLVKTDLNYFEYRNGCYIIDTELSRVDINTGLNVLYYHQDINKPFRIDIDSTRLTETVKNIDDIPDKAFNPFNLKDYIISQTIEKVLKGGELLNDIAVMKKLVIAILGSNLLLLILVLRTMGYI